MKAPFLSPTNSARWRNFGRIVLLNLLAWLAISALGALTSYSGKIRSGLAVNYLPLLENWCNTSALLAILSIALYFIFARWPVQRAKTISLGYLLILLLFMPLELLYLAAVHVIGDGLHLNTANLARQFSTMPTFLWFSELSLVSCVYAAMVALSMWQQSKAREHALQQAHTDNLQLRLALEQQKLVAIRAQLEPHFMFNALNAISALVRADDKKIALSGIHRLSDLLRYALTASERDWVSLREEMKFVQDYLALQRLRYGERLQVQINGLQQVAHADCPPLLLQPLLENALRHDLECHDQPSEIQLDFTHQQQQLCLTISNRATGLTSNNPGLGLGLPQTQARLQLAYGASASLQTAYVQGRFCVSLRLPLQRPDDE